ncbi:WhiB family transcriptional regulator [Nocardiopsis alba]|uniref:WhiB family transcriptional regulator n=1 Tax=Nocardiopsis alba TaxID=53437 RepID=UPI0033A998F4
MELPCSRDPELFYGPEEETPRAQRRRENAAIRLCGTCSVATSCLEDALRRHEWHGVWGGTGERERRRMRKRMDAGLDPFAVPAGQVSTLGDSRILQGLTADGYDMGMVRAWTRIPEGTLDRVRSRERRTWALSSSRKLRNAVPLVLEQTPRSPEGLRRWAQRRRWIPLDAWVWEEIDLPQARPLSHRRRT